MKNKLKGFTLVELVITIAIVIILSLVSVPIYQNYTRKAKWSEGYALLGAILSAQKAYYSEYGNFLQDCRDGHNNQYTCFSPTLGVNAAGNKYFTAFNISATDKTVKYAVNAFTKIPTDLRNNNGRQDLRLWFNITTGVTIDEQLGLIRE